MLFTTEDWVTEKELSNLGDCSAGATYRTIDFLNAFARTNDGLFEIVSKKNNGYKLDVIDTLSRREIENIYLKETLTFKILDAIIQSQPESALELADLLFVSQSTIYRRLKILSEHLAENSLEFDTKTLSISGSEHLIREFFFRVYWAVFDFKEWPFRHRQYETFAEQFESTLKKTDLALLKHEKAHIIYRLAINAIRHEQGIYLEELPIQPLMSPNFAEFTEELTTFIPQGLPETVHDNECYYLATGILVNPIFDDRMDRYSPVVLWHAANSTGAYYFASSLLGSLVSRASYVDIQNKNKLIYNFFSAYYHILFFSEIRVFTINIHEFVGYFREEYEELMAVTEKIVADSLDCLPLDLDEAQQEFLVYKIFLMLSSSIVFSKTKKSAYVKLVCIGEPLIESYLKQYLATQIDFPLVIHTSSSEKNFEGPYDIFLIDSVVEERDLPPAEQTYIYQIPPNDRDLKKIRELLNSVETT